MTTQLPPALWVVLHMIDVLEELGIRHHLGGSFASAIHGVPRQTMDADFVIEVDVESVARLADHLREDHYVDVEVAKEAAAHRGSFNAIHLVTGFKLDFFVKGMAEFDEIELERSELTQITDDPPRFVHVKSAEDTILRKLEWYRNGGETSDRQWRDVLGILMAARTALDLEYLRRWAANLGVDDLVERALGEAGSG